MYKLCKNDNSWCSYGHIIGSFIIIIIYLLVEPGTNISRDKAQSVEQQDIQGSQGALTVAFETLSNKHKMKT